MADSSAKPETILVVDDDEMVLEMVVSLLNSEKFVTLQATGGQDALTSRENTRPFRPRRPPGSTTRQIGNCMTGRPESARLA